MTASAESLTAVRSQASGLPASGGSGRRSEGHGRRLTSAFEALEAFPALSESRNRLMRVVDGESDSSHEIVSAVESDVALCVSVLRLANSVDGPRAGRVTTVDHAVEVLTPFGVRTLAEGARTVDFFERSGVWAQAPERFRLHAVATQRAAERVVAELEDVDRGRIMVAALLHDIGKLVLTHAYPGYPDRVHRDAHTPDERLRQERRELGVDHALVGGVLMRRWGLPRQLASAVERHHADDASGDAAIVRLADLLAHYDMGDPVGPQELLDAGKALGLGPRELRRVLYDLPYPRPARPRPTRPCPLSGREMEVLRRLAEGKVYKQIAVEMQLSTSTVRTHLHNIYGKLGAVDRAQAVLTAAEAGWL